MAMELSRGLSPDAIPTLLEWANSGGEAFLKRFAGPQWQYPLTREQLAPEEDEIYSIYVDGTFVGILQQVARHEHSVHLGRILIDPDKRGQGLGPQALGLMCRELFRDPDMDFISLNVYLDNAPARRCYEKCGFKVTQINPEWNNCRMELARAQAADDIRSISNDV